MSPSNLIICKCRVCIRSEMDLEHKELHEQAAHGKTCETCTTWGSELIRACLTVQLLYYYQIEFLKAKTQYLRYCISAKSAAKHHSITSIWVLLGHDIHMVDAGMG